MAEITLNEGNFSQEILQASVPAMVDFWAPWCGPCKVLEPIVAQIAEEFAGRLVVGKVNVDDNPALAGQYNVMSIPTLVFFKDGQQVDISVGAGSKDALVAKINALLA